jgi:hypothetical protein
MIRNRYSTLVFAAASAMVILATVSPAEAQRDPSLLVDKFSLKLEGSWVALNTQIRLDSEALGRGTTLDFESDLGLGKSKIIPTLDFAWHITRKQKLGMRWQDINRDSSAQALTEIQWGDYVIPVDADIALGFDITQVFIDYTHYFWAKERWAAGFGIGIRLMEIDATLTWNEENIQDGGSSEVRGTAPLPYLYFEYRRMFSEHWRFKAGLGWFYVKIGDVKGDQWIGRVDAEYLLGKRWALGGALNASDVSVDWEGLKDHLVTGGGESLLTAALDMGINDFSIFVRLRF